MFNDLGAGMLENAWQGYNSTIFAYGQTGSGKSYTIMGHGANKGITSHPGLKAFIFYLLQHSRTNIQFTRHELFPGLVPRVCEELFNSIESKKKTGINYEVSFSMLEIYNEKVRDLLSKKKTPHGGLKIKMSKDQGFHGNGHYSENFNTCRFSS